jgi:hypothetical protein
MVRGLRTLLAIAVGYLLGRRRKTKLRQGAQGVSSSDMLGKLSPELSEVTGRLRDELTEAAKAAAVAVVSSRIDSLSDRLHDRAETLRNPAAAAGGVGDIAQETPGDEQGGDQDVSQNPMRPPSGSRGAPGEARRRGGAAGKIGKCLSRLVVWSARATIFCGPARERAPPS